MTVVGCLKYSAVDLRDIEDVRLSRHARHGACSSAAKRADAAPVKLSRKLLAELLRSG